MSNNSGGTFVRTPSIARLGNVSPLTTKHPLASNFPENGHGFQAYTAHDFHVGAAPHSQSNNANGTWWRGFAYPATHFVGLHNIRDVHSGDY